MKFTTCATAALLTAAATAAPTNTIDKRATQICGQWDSAVSGAYTLYNDQWNINAGTGSQCATLDGASGSGISWTTSWSWSDASNQVKTYANVVTATKQVQLSAIESLATTWAWTYTGSNVVADVAYDVFTSDTAGGSNAYEIMIWLGALGGAGPISSTGSPVATPSIDGSTWKLYKGPNGSTTVFSFVANSNVNNFNGDVMDFLNYLIQSQGLPASQYLVSVGAGTEPFTGSNAVLTTSQYSLTPTYA